MKKEQRRSLFCTLFLGIFMMKMLISATPLFLSWTDRSALNAVIMQLEIEDSAEKSAEKVKTSVAKDYCSDILSFTFLSPMQHLEDVSLPVHDDEHVTTFYPAVPTPPPNG